MSAELTRLCHRSLPFQQTTLALEVTRLGQSLDSYSMDKGSVAYMTGTCETRGLVFSIRISILSVVVLSPPVTGRGISPAVPNINGWHFTNRTLRMTALDLV